MTVTYDKHYADSDAACGAPFKEFVAFAQSLSGPGVRVLDLGCGQGRDSLLFARLGCVVVGVDLSSVGIEQLRAVARVEKLEIEAHVADICQFEPSGEFDIVLLDRVLHMLSTDEARSEVLSKAMKATLRGGHLLVADGPKHRDRIRDALQNQGWTLVKDTKNRSFAQRP